LNTLEQLKARGLVVTGHFVYPSRLHGDDFVCTEKIFHEPRLVSHLGSNVAHEFKDDNIEAVVGRELCAAILAQCVAHHLSELRNENVLAVQARRSAGNTYTLQNGGGELIQGKRVLVVDDIVDSGGTMRKVVQMVRRFTGNVVGVGTICNRGSSDTHTVGEVPKFIALAQLGHKTWQAEECRHRGPCKKKIPITKDLSRQSGGRLPVK
jgi:orotate phosphoribosyltransferase